MPKPVRDVAIGLVALFALLAASGAASALTVSPTGSYTAISRGSVSFTLDSTGQVLTCTSASISATLSSNGLATAPVGSLTFSGCSNPLLGAFTITQVRAATGQVVLAPIDAMTNLVGLRIVVPLDVSGRGAFLIRTASGNCSFEGSGSGTIGGRYPTPLPAIIGTSDPYTILDMRIVLLNVIGCSPLLVTNGLTGRFSGTGTLSRGLTVSG